MTKKPPHEVAKMMLDDIRIMTDRMQEEVELMLIPGFDDLLPEHVNNLRLLAEQVAASAQKAYEFGKQVTPP